MPAKLALAILSGAALGFGLYTLPFLGYVTPEEYNNRILQGYDPGATYRILGTVSGVYAGTDLSSDPCAFGGRHFYFDGPTWRICVKTGPSSTIRAGEVVIVTFWVGLDDTSSQSGKVYHVLSGSSVRVEHYPSSNGLWSVSAGILAFLVLSLGFADKLFAVIPAVTVSLVFVAQILVNPFAWVVILVLFSGPLAYGLAHHALATILRETPEKNESQVAISGIGIGSQVFVLFSIAMFLVLVAFGVPSFVLFAVFILGMVFFAYDSMKGEESWARPFVALFLEWGKEISRAVAAARSSLGNLGALLPLIVVLALEYLLRVGHSSIGSDELIPAITFAVASVQTWAAWSAGFLGGE